MILFSLALRVALRAILRVGAFGVLSLALLSGCASRVVQEMPYYTYGMREAGASGVDPVMKLAIKDGCETAYFSRGNALYGTIMKPRIDPYLTAHSKAYYRSWKFGYVYCFQAALANTHMAFGQKFVHSSDSYWISKPSMYIGNENYSPKIPFTEDINKAIPGFDNLSNPNSSKTFGIFGTCAFC